MNQTRINGTEQNILHFQEKTKNQEISIYFWKSTENFWTTTAKLST